jgi:PhzF family phenazine biosynthesis protein
MLSAARSMNVSHSAFIFDDNNSGFSIRFFTGEGEIKNCAHAAIAANFLRAEKNGITSGSFIQKTIAGEQKVKITTEGGELKVFFEQNEIQFKQPSGIEELSGIIGITPDDIDSSYPVILASAGNYRFLLPLNQNKTLQNLKPDLQLLKKHSEKNNHIGCFVYTITSENDFTANGRMFAPAIGVDEDIINGNCSGCLGAFIMKTLNLNKINLKVQQGHHFNRIGTVEVFGSIDSGRVKTLVGGQAVTDKSVIVSV